MSWFRCANIICLVYFTSKSFWLDLNRYSPTTNEGTSTLAISVLSEEADLFHSLDASVDIDDEDRTQEDEYGHVELSNRVMDEDAWEAAISAPLDAPPPLSQSQISFDSIEDEFRIEKENNRPTEEEAQRHTTDNDSGTKPKPSSTGEKAALKPQTAIPDATQPKHQPRSAPRTSDGDSAVGHAEIRPSLRRPRNAKPVNIRLDRPKAAAAKAVAATKEDPTSIFRIKRATLPPFDPSTSTAKFAYVFYLGGVTGDNKRHPGHFYNVLVSIQILKDSGSKADMILLVHPTHPSAKLPPSQQAVLEDLNVEVRYTTDSKDSAAKYMDPTIYFGAVPLEKFRVFDWIQYDRVMVLDADIMPHCNLDYFFHSSMDGTLQPNVMISIGELPISTNIMLIRPVAGYHYSFLKMVAKFPHKRFSRWWQFPMGEWTSLYKEEAKPRRKLKQQSSEDPAIQTAWYFPGLNSDVGFLLAWMRYRVRNFSWIVGSRVYNVRDSRRHLGNPQPNPLLGRSCRAPKDPPNQTFQEYFKSEARKHLSPFNVGPYSDFAQWQHDAVKPWEMTKQQQKESWGAVKRWFRVLTHLDEKHRLGLGLAEKDKPWLRVQPHRPSAVVPSTGLFVPLMEEWAKKQLHANLTQSYSSAATARLSRQSTPGKKRRAFVCVTGQLERLELQNKVKRLFKPILERDYELDVSLVLTGGKSIYTNHDKTKTTMNVRPFYSNFTHAADVLKAKGIHVVSESVYHRKDEPPFRDEYYELLRQVQKTFRADDVQRERAMNHARIFESYGRCLAEAKEAVPKGDTLENYYDVFMRIRDDVGFERELPKAILTNLLQTSPGSVQVTECRGWYGMNDRFASVAPDAAQVYFTELYQKYLNNVFPKDKVYNPETYLLATYAEAGLHVLANRDLTGVFKIVMTPRGKPAFAPDDLTHRRCPGYGEDKYRERLYELYGWDF